MKLSLSFLLFAAVFQFGSSIIISKSGIQKLLLSYTNAVQNGSDAIMAKPGPLDFILDGNELVFEVCSLECNGDFLVCYGSDPSGFQTVLDGCDTKCALGNKISFVKPFSTNFPGVVKSDLCFEVKMKNGAPSILSSEGEIANTTTCAPKVENGVMTLNNNYATSECSASSKNAIIKHETTTIPPPTTATLGQFGRLSFGENGHAFAAITDEPGSFFNDYWWIFLILALILVAVGIGIGVCCYLRRKKNAQPIPARRRKLQGSKSTVVSTEAQKCKTENAVRLDSLFQQSSILSQMSLLYSKKEEPKKEKSMPLSRMKQQLLQQQQQHLDHMIKLHLVKMNTHLLQQPMNQKALWQIIGRFFQSVVLPSSPLMLELASIIFNVKRNPKKPIPTRRRRLQSSKSPIVLQPSTETQQRKTESAVLPNSLYNQSSILSHKSLLNSKKDEPKKEAPESTDLTSMKPTA